MSEKREKLGAGRAAMLASGRKALRKTGRRRGDPDPPEKRSGQRTRVPDSSRRRVMGKSLRGWRPDVSWTSAWDDPRWPEGVLG